MKSIFTLALAVMLSFTLAPESQAKKRFGSGGFGQVFKTAPLKKAAPASPNKGMPLAGNKRSRPGMGGLMGGLLAGGMFAYLLGNGAFEGIQFMDILLFGLIGFVLFKMFASRNLAVAGHGSGQQQGAQSGFLQGFSNQADNDIPMNLPDGLDQEGFTERALGHFKLLHKAWDQADMSVVQEYLDANLYQALCQQRESFTEKQDHDVLDLSAEIVRAESTVSGHVLSVLFRGRMKELTGSQELGIYDTWHLQQQANGSWLIIGIEAE